MNMTDFEQYSLLLTLIALICSIIGLCFQLNRARKQETLDATFAFFEQYENLTKSICPSTAQLIGLHTMADTDTSRKNFNNLSPEEVRDLNLLSQFFERLAICIANKYVDEKLMCSYLGPIVTRIYNNLEPYFRETKETTGIDICQNFKILVTKWGNS